MSNLFNKQVLVLFDTSDTSDISDISDITKYSAWLGGVIGTVTEVERRRTETILVISTSEFNALTLFVKQIQYGHFYLESLKNDTSPYNNWNNDIINLNNSFRCVSVIPLSSHSIPPSIQPEQRSIFDIWLKRIVVTFIYPSDGYLSIVQGIVTHLKVRKVNCIKTSVHIGISDNFGRMICMSILCSSELCDFAAIRENIKENTVVSIILPDERNLQLLNKRFKRVMSLDALSVVAKYLIGLVDA